MCLLILAYTCLYITTYKRKTSYDNSKFILPNDEIYYTEELVKLFSNIRIMINKDNIRDIYKNLFGVEMSDKEYNIYIASSTVTT